MPKRLSLLAPLAAASLLVACVPPASSPPVEVAASPVATQAPPAPAEARAVRIRSALSERVLSGAAVTVRLASDLSLVAEGLKLDEQGALTLPLNERLKPGTVVVVQAKSGDASLSGLYTVPPATFTVQQAAGQAAQSSEWLLDLATSAVTRKLTSKLADVMRSLPPGAESAAVAAVMTQVNALVEKVRSTLQEGLKDSGAANAAKQALQNPTGANVESLANGIILGSPLKSAFVQAIEACNRQVFDNLVAGGPLVVPSRWQVFDVIVAPPEVRVVGTNEVEIVYGDKKVKQNVPDAAQKVADAQKKSTDTISNETFADINTNIIYNGSSGTPPSLRGTIKVAGVVRAGALVQLSALDGSVVAKTSSGVDGSYAFYNVPDGTYHLIVAVDGAVQSTRLVTIGNPT